LNKVLEELKAVQGVSGVLIMDLRTLVTYQLLPAHFEKDRFRDLAMNLVEVCQRAKKPVRIDLRFDNGVAFFTRVNKIVILVYGRPSLNLSLLKLVIRSSIRTIERKLDTKEKKSEEKSEQGRSASPDQTYIQTLIKTLNQLTKEYSKFTGSYQLTQNLRLAKEKLLLEFPFLTNFYVDNSGIISLVKAEVDLEKEKVVLSFSRWASLLTELSQEVSPNIADLKIRELTKEMSDELEGMGFYDMYEKQKTEKSLLGF
jgi:predicted regulator of Ras-like GTPase activity (Roadblock/LC7/MglB family)